MTLLRMGDNKGTATAMVRNALALVIVAAPIASVSCAETSPGSHFARMSVGPEGHVRLTQEAPRDDAGNEGYCTYLDTRRRTWGAFSATFGVLAGGGAATAIAIQNQNDYGRAAIALSFLGATAVAALSAYLSSDYGSTEKAHGCIAGFTDVALEDGGVHHFRSATPCRPGRLSWSLSQSTSAPRNRPSQSSS